MTPAFRFIDLFAGIGGFHAAMRAYGGECVYAVEIDPKAARVYEANWGHPALGDITKDADDDLGIMNVPAHDVLCAGFPCQPFSKSGAQRGMDEARGTLFFNIASIIKAHHPAVVLLENVRNLIGPRHEHEWDVIIETLRDEGYHVSDTAAVFSPHLLPPELGGAPQVRERVFITATYAPGVVAGDVEHGGPTPVAAMTDRFLRHLKAGDAPAGDAPAGDAPAGDAPASDALIGASGTPAAASDARTASRPVAAVPAGSRTRVSEAAVPGAAAPSGLGGGVVFDPKRDWHLEDLLDDSHNMPGCDLTPSETLWIDAWDEFVRIMRERMNDRPLPGHPIWADAWLDFPEMRAIDWTAGAGTTVEIPSRVTMPAVDVTLPAWKQSHLRKNYDLFARHFADIIAWALRWGVYTDRFPTSRRKLEWQAQETKSLWETVMHLRPSGIRAKKPTYLPALVAITQTSIVGPRERRLSPRETARLQGLPDSFVFPNQSAAATYKQMGNGVNVGAVWHVFRRHIDRDRDLLAGTQQGQALVEAVDTAPIRPNEILALHEPAAQT